MKPRRKKELGSLDSLLDTLTSVVGILLIMLIVIQLDVSTAVQRIISEQENLEKTVGDTQLASVRASVQELSTERDTAKAALDAATKARESGSTEAQAIRAQMADLTRKIAQAEKDAAAARQLVVEADKKKAEIAKLEKDLAALQTDYTDDRKKLAGTPVPNALPAKVVRLPSPQAAPEGAKPLYVLCRNGLVSMVDQDGLIKAVKEGIEKSGLKPNAIKEYDGKKAEALFKNRYIGDKDWRIKSSVSNFRLRFQLFKQPRNGENLRQIQSKVSRYQLILNRVDREKRYIVFIVWPDSYDTYLVARAVAQQRGFTAGWRPEITKDAWATYLGTYLTLGYKENLKPPTGPAAPAGPPKPVDVVD